MENRSGQGRRSRVRPAAATPWRWSARRRRLCVTTLLDGATAACGIALLATSAWLISRAAEHPPSWRSGVAIIGVRFFAVSRGLCRYGERLVGHDTALRVLADLRVRVYERLEALAPAGLPAFRRGDLLARLVQDVDSPPGPDAPGDPPYGAALLVGVPDRRPWCGTSCRRRADPGRGADLGRCGAVPGSRSAWPGGARAAWPQPGGS